jgi:hypothetical protein
VKPIAAGKHAVNLDAVATKWLFQVEEQAEKRLHFAYALADGDLAALPRFQQLRRTEVVRMRMRFKDPIESKPTIFKVRADDIDLRGIGSTGYDTETEHRIDDSGARCCRIADNVAKRAGGLVKEVLNERIGYRHVLSGEIGAKSPMPGWMPCAQKRIWKKSPAGSRGFS